MVLFEAFGIRKLFKKIDILLGGREDKILEATVNTLDLESLVKILETIAHGRKKMFSLIESPKAAKVLRGLSPYIRQYVLSEVKVDKILSLINFLESDEIADLIKILPAASRAGVVNELKKHDPKKVLKLLHLREGTAGGIMKTEIIAGKMSDKVSEFIQNLRETFPGSVPKTSYVYILDDHGKLLGAINFNKLYIVNPDTKLKEIMHATKRPVKIDQDQEEVARSFTAQDALELPVVDNNGALVGRITADDIIDVLRTEFSEDVFRLVGAFGNERANDSFARKIKNRLPWLLLNLGTAILAAVVISQFTDVISKFIILAAIMPIIAGMGGNAATQTLGVTIRAIALGEINNLNTWKIIVKEIFVGSLNGLITGIVMGTLVYLYNGNLTLAIVIAAAMTFNLFVAALGGVAIPLIMRAFKIDPALASTVFVTTMTDIAGFFSFLGLSTLLLK
ncbi:MAG: magnesium transporter [bacterium]|nr:magnesium transporter [bacterium]